MNLGKRKSKSMRWGWREVGHKGAARSPQRGVCVNAATRADGCYGVPTLPMYSSVSYAIRTVPSR